jgi:hypothetical protein
VTAPAWVLKETVIALHEQLIAKFGGSRGLRDEGLLDSALARARHLYSYGTPRLPALAASCAFGLVKDHPFGDGNKRIGFAVLAGRSAITAASVSSRRRMYGRPCARSGPQPPVFSLGRPACARKRRPPADA